MRVDYSPRSLRHLQTIHDHIAQDSPAAAVRTLTRIRGAIERLAVLPLSGRAARLGTRVLAVPGCRMWLFT